MNIVDKIIGSKYVATVDMIAELARQRTIFSTKREKSGATYLTVLIVATQNAVIDLKADVLGQLEKVHREFYNAVMKGINSTGLKGLEASKKATFARTAKSTLVAYIKSGGDVRGLNIHETTKESLRQAFAPPEPGYEYAIMQVTNLVLGKIRKIAKKDPGEAIEELHIAIGLLSSALNELEEGQNLPGLPVFRPRTQPGVGYHPHN